MNDQGEMVEVDESKYEEIPLEKVIEEVTDETLRGFMCERIEMMFYSNPFNRLFALRT